MSVHLAQRRRPAQVAEWARHSVAVLLRVYAKCIDGQDQIARRRIEEARPARIQLPTPDLTWARIGRNQPPSAVSSRSQPESEGWCYVMSSQVKHLL